MKSFYIDTSVINYMYDDPKTSALLDAIQSKSKVYISVFTIAELAATHNADRRLGLLKIAKDISGRYRPLAMPGDLLKLSLDAVNACAPSMDHSMSTEWDGVWIALNDPSLINEGAYNEIIEWKRLQEKWYQDIHSQGRPRMQEAVSKLSQKEGAALISRFSNLIRYYHSNRAFLNDVVADIAAHSENKVVVDNNLVQRIIRNSEHWRFFLASITYSIFARSLRSSHFSKDKNPGSIDTQQSIYLAACDIFVTADESQYSMLRLLTPFGHKKRQVWKYSKLSRWLLKDK